MSNNDKNNPWGEAKPPRKRTITPIQPPGRPRGGTGGRGPSSGGEGPDIEMLMRKGRQEWQKFSGGDNGLRSFMLGALILIFLWGISGFYRIEPSEHGVILRFGEIVETRTSPGWGWHVPAPIETIDILNVSQERRLPIGIDAGGRDIPSESLMLTGDENIIDLDFVVLWNIQDSVNYLYTIRDPAQTLQKVAESAMREIIARTKLEEVLAPERAGIEIAARELIQTIIDGYSAGIRINGVELQDVKPPEQVADAFNEVNRAQADRERFINEAQAYRNDILPRAEGQAAQLLQDAEAYKGKVVSHAIGEADRFNKIYESYRQARAVTERRLYLETMEAILRNADVMILGEDAAKSAVPYLPLDSRKTKPEAR